MNAILEGKICPYCQNSTEFVDSSKVYGKSYGMVYACFPCKAYVGCHKNKSESLGSLANSELRKLRGKCHKYFDPLWNQSDRPTKSRHLAYKWLSRQLNIPLAQTHIGMFNKAQCLQTIELCKELHRAINDENRPQTQSR